MALLNRLIFTGENSPPHPLVPVRRWRLGFTSTLSGDQYVTVTYLDGSGVYFLNDTHAGAWKWAAVPGDPLGFVVGERVRVINDTANQFRILAAATLTNDEGGHDAVLLEAVFGNEKGYFAAFILDVLKDPES